MRPRTPFYHAVSCTGSNCRTSPGAEARGGALVLLICHGGNHFHLHVDIAIRLPLQVTFTKDPCCQRQRSVQPAAWLAEAHWAGESPDELVTQIGNMEVRLLACSWLPTFVQPAIHCQSAPNRGLARPPYTAVQSQSWALQSGVLLATLFLSSHALFGFMCGRPYC
jgi:hypothetical protein